MNKLRVLEGCPAIGVHHVDLLRIETTCLNIDKEVEAVQESVFEIMRRVHAIWDPLRKIGDRRWWHNQRDGKARLKCVLIPNVADLLDVRLDKLETVALDSSIPLSEVVLYATSGSPDPLQFEMEDSCGVVDDVVVQDNAFSLVTSLMNG